MFSDPALQRAESEIQKLRADIQRLFHDEGEARDRADRAIRRINADLERDIAINDRRKKDLERSIARHEQDIAERRREIEREAHLKK